MGFVISHRSSTATFRPCLRASVRIRWAILHHELHRSLVVDQANDEETIQLHLPGLAREDLSLRSEEGRLLVGVNGHERHVPTTSAVKASTVVARFRGEVLHHTNPSFPDRQRVRNPPGEGEDMALEGLSKKDFPVPLGFLQVEASPRRRRTPRHDEELRRALQEADFNVRQTKEIVEQTFEKSRMREEEPRPGITFQTHAMNILYTELVRLLEYRPSEFRPHGNTLLLVWSLQQGKTTDDGEIGQEWYLQEARACTRGGHQGRRSPTRGLCSAESVLLEDLCPRSTVNPAGPKTAPTIVRNGLRERCRHRLISSSSTPQDGTSSTRSWWWNLTKSPALGPSRRALVGRRRCQLDERQEPVAAASFHDLAGVTGIVLHLKLDGTAKSWWRCLSSKVPLRALPSSTIGVGEQVRTSERFESDRFISRLLGNAGDIQGLIDAGS